MGVSFLCVRNLVTACCLMWFDAVENESSILNQIEHKPLYLPSHTPWNLKVKEQQTNKLGQVPLQGHATCTGYLCGGFTFWMPFVYTLKQRPLKLIPDIRDFLFTHCVPQDSGLLAYNAVSVGLWFTVFQRIILLLFSVVKECRIIPLGLFSIWRWRQCGPLKVGTSGKSHIPEHPNPLINVHHSVCISVMLASPNNKRTSQLSV
jgi:hypothetical protein